MAYIGQEFKPGDVVETAEIYEVEHRSKARTEGLIDKGIRGGRDDRTAAPRDWSRGSQES